MHLGRRHAPDARDHQHLLAAKLPIAVTRPKKKTWRVWWAGDQGETSQCVGYALHCMLRALPHLQREPSPSVIYHEAQKRDEWSGENYEGTSVRGGAKALLAAGKLKEYSWAFDLETVLNWLGAKGPTVWGVNWYSSMYRTDPETGLLSIGGAIDGGHAVCCLGYDDKNEWLIFQNSWGKSFGINGRFKLRYADAERLLREEGECCAPVEVLP